jgi:hypothetical protein
MRLSLLVFAAITARFRFVSLSNPFSVRRRQDRTAWSAAVSSSRESWLLAARQEVSRGH